MTRLERHIQQQNRQRMLVTGIVLLGLIYFFLNFGVPALIGLSTRVGASLSSGKSNSDSQGSVEFATVDLNDVPDATNSATIKVSGSTSNLKTVSIFLNGTREEQIDVLGKSDFKTTIDGLRSGSNEIYAEGIGTDPKNTRKSSRYTVNYRANKPSLEITSPADHSSTPRSEITISGKTDPGADLSVKIYGQPVVVSADGTFSSSVKLNEGDNTISVDVTDSAGNTESKSITVKYEK